MRREWNWPSQHIDDLRILRVFPSQTNILFVCDWFDHDNGFCLYHYDHYGAVLELCICCISVGSHGIVCYEPLVHVHLTIQVV